MAVLNAKKRSKMPAKEFAGPGKSFPVNDPVHARMAISGATRSERAGNISASQADSIKAKARAKLGIANEGKSVKKKVDMDGDYDNSKMAKGAKMDNDGDKASEVNKNMKRAPKVKADPQKAPEKMERDLGKKKDMDYKPHEESPVKKNNGVPKYVPSGKGNLHDHAGFMFHDSMKPFHELPVGHSKKY